MDWLQFTAAVIGHIAWPLVILILLIMVRKHIGALAERLLEFSFGGAKITFDKILQKGAEIIEQTPPAAMPPPEPQLEPPISGDMKWETIARDFARRRRERNNELSKSPFGKVLSGLDEVDSLLFAIGDELGIDAADASSIMHTLLEQKRMPESIGKLYQTLRDARNLVAHSPSLPDNKEALEYIRQTSYLKDVLLKYKDALYKANHRNN